MLSSFLSHANYWSIGIAALAYFIVGSLWFSVLFGKIWSAEMQKNGVTIKEPAKNEIAKKMIQTFLGNLLAAVSIAYLVFVTGISNWQAGIKLGLLCGIGFAAAAISIAYTWESRSMKLVMIDCGYAVFGIALCGLILSTWH
jgi:hypothetical protein